MDRVSRSIFERGVNGTERIRYYNFYRRVFGAGHQDKRRMGRRLVWMLAVSWNDRGSKWKLKEIPSRYGELAKKGGDKSTPETW